VLTQVAQSTCGIACYQNLPGRKTHEQCDFTLRLTLHKARVLNKSRPAVPSTLRIFLWFCLH